MIIVKGVLEVYLTGSVNRFKWKYKKKFIEKSFHIERDEVPKEDSSKSDSACVLMVRNPESSVLAVIFGPRFEG